MAVLRGKGRGIELDFSERPFDEALAELEERLSANPGFYAGSTATAVFGTVPPQPEDLDILKAALSVFGIGLEVLSGPDEIAPLAAQAELEFRRRESAAQPDVLARRRSSRPQREISLSEAARSLAADFAGARADLAARRSSGVPIRQFTPPVARRSISRAAPVLAAAPNEPATEYHLGTVRGGQSLHHLGNLVVVGDVNPGAELVASGDILVFGALRGVAHAGAQGDLNARVYALRLEPTQLRIATLIAADERQREDADRLVPEIAHVRDGRIAIVPYDRISEHPEEKQR
ncbi:MAG: septum site-determining protein MinC [Candidatus Eremiobacteraeota bacterium]|nr:septum site-determining protein MinC [Candidatus Eremiobacteraeota bacterium]